MYNYHGWLLNISPTPRREFSYYDVRHQCTEDNISTVMFWLTPPIDATCIYCKLTVSPDVDRHLRAVWNLLNR